MEEEEQTETESLKNKLAQVLQHVQEASEMVSLAVSKLSSTFQHLHAASLILAELVDTRSEHRADEAINHLVPREVQASEDSEPPPKRPRLVVLGYWSLFHPH